VRIYPTLKSYTTRHGWWIYESWNIHAEI